MAGNNTLTPGQMEWRNFCFLQLQMKVARQGHTVGCTRGHSSSMLEQQGTADIGQAGWDFAGIPLDWLIWINFPGSRAQGLPQLSDTLFWGNQDRCIQQVHSDPRVRQIDPDREWDVGSSWGMDFIGCSRRESDHPLIRVSKLGQNSVYVCMCMYKYINTYIYICIYTLIFL